MKIFLYTSLRHILTKLVILIDTMIILQLNITFDTAYKLCNLQSYSWIELILWLSKMIRSELINIRKHNQLNLTDQYKQILMFIKIINPNKFDNNYLQISYYSTVFHQFV